MAKCVSKPKAPQKPVKGPSSPKAPKSPSPSKTPKMGVGSDSTMAGGPSAQFPSQALIGLRKRAK